MSKRDNMLRGGLSELLSPGTVTTIEQQPIAPKAPQPAPAAETEAEPEYGRLCAVVNVAKMDKLRTIATREKLTIKEVLEAAMDLAIDAYERRNGTVEVTASRRKTNPARLFR